MDKTVIREIVLCLGILLTVGMSACGQAPVDSRETSALLTPEELREDINAERVLVVDVEDRNRQLAVAFFEPTESGGRPPAAVYEMNDGTIKEGAEPYQSIQEGPGNYMTAVARDFNGDGFTDFDQGTVGDVNGMDLFYLWDPEDEQFHLDRELSELMNPQFLDGGVIQEFVHGSAAAYESNYYRYVEGKLTPVRSVRAEDPELETWIQHVIVTDWNGSDWDTVMERWFDTNGGEDNSIYEELEKWWDLDYRG